MKAPNGPVGVFFAAHVLLKSLKGSRGPDTSGKMDYFSLRSSVKFFFTLRWLNCVMLRKWPQHHCTWMNMCIPCEWLYQLCNESRSMGTVFNISRTTNICRGRRGWEAGAPPTESLWMCVWRTQSLDKEEQLPEPHVTPESTWGVRGHLVTCSSYTQHRREEAAYINRVSSSMSPIKGFMALWSIYSFMSWLKAERRIQGSNFPSWRCSKGLKRAKEKKWISTNMNIV